MQEPISITFSAHPCLDLTPLPAQHNPAGCRCRRSQVGADARIGGWEAASACSTRARRRIFRAPSARWAKAPVESEKPRRSHVLSLFSVGDVAAGLRAAEIRTW